MTGLFKDRQHSIIVQLVQKSYQATATSCCNCICDWWCWGASWVQYFLHCNSIRAVRWCYGTSWVQYFFL